MVHNTTNMRLNLLATCVVSNSKERRTDKAINRTHGSRKGLKIRVRTLIATFITDAPNKKVKPSRPAGGRCEEGKEAAHSAAVQHTVSILSLWVSVTVCSGCMQIVLDADSLEAD